MENVVYCAYLKQTYKSYANASSWSYRASTATPLRKTIQAAASLLAHTWRRSSISVRDLNSKRPFLMSHSCCAWMCLLKEVYWFWIKKKNKFKYRGAGLLVQGHSVTYEGAGGGTVNSPSDTGAHNFVQLFKGIHLIYIFWGLWFKRSAKLWEHNHKTNCSGQA